MRSNKAMNLPKPVTAAGSHVIARATPATDSFRAGFAGCRHRVRLTGSGLTLVKRNMTWAGQPAYEVASGTETCAMRSFTTKSFTTKQVVILVLVIVAAIAFLETSQPVLTGAFWRAFLLKVLIYGAVSEFVVVALCAWTKLFNDSDDL